MQYASTAAEHRPQDRRLERQCPPKLKWVRNCWASPSRKRKHSPAESRTGKQGRPDSSLIRAFICQLVQICEHERNRHRPNRAVASGLHLLELLVVLPQESRHILASAARLVPVEWDWQLGLSGLTGSRISGWSLNRHFSCSWAWLSKDSLW